MSKTTKTIAIITGVAALGLIGAYAFAQQGQGLGHGRIGMHMGMGHGGIGPGMTMGMSRGMGQGMEAGMASMHGGSATASEMQELHQMFVGHDKIKRTVTNLPNGIRTVTESDDPEMTRILVSHVAGMMKRVEESRNPRLPMQSPQLEIIFRNKDKIKTSFEPTATGIAVTQISDDAETVTALQRHAADVTDAVQRGMVAAHETMMRKMGGAMGHHAMDHGAASDHRH